MFGILINSLKTGVITETEPLGVPASFGFPVIDFSRCTACDECARACPTGAINRQRLVRTGRSSPCRAPPAFSAERA